MNPKRLRAYILLLTVVAIWGGAGPIIKYTLGGIDPLPFLTYRFALASIFSIAFFLVKIKRGKKFRRLRANIGLAALYGILAVPLALGTLFLGLDKSTVLDLTLVSILGPLLIASGGALFFNEHITKRERLGIAIVLIGVIFNSFFPLFRPDESSRLTGNILLLIYLLADSSSVLIAKIAVRRKIKPANLTNLAFIIGFILIAPISLYTYGASNLIKMVIKLPFSYHLGVWYMAFLSGNLAYYFYIRAQKTIEVSEASLFSYLTPAFGVPLAIIWLKEKPTTSFLIGAPIIIFGLILAEYKKRNSNA